MKDIGHEETEKVLEEIEKRISEEYAIAEKEIAEKLDDYLKKFRVKDALKQKAVDSGKITEEEYKQWRVGQIMMTKRWTEMRDTLAEDFTNADKIARSIAYDHMPEVYAINHDYATFQVEKGSLMDTSYTLYDRNAFEQLVKDEDTFIPAPGRKVSRDIKEGKALAWNKKQVQSVMMQGLLQGESIPKLAKRLSKTVGESDRKAAIRNARTMTTGVQNAGRVASYDRANKMGIETRKQWLATLDSRTRHWHASLDGEVVDNDKPFQNDFGDIMYPGDPTADPANIFNCRCTLIASIKGFERDVSNTDLRHDDHLKDMSYEEWREGHYEQTSEPITRQEDMSEKIKNDYIQDYIDINASIPDEVREGFDKFEDKYSNAKTEHYIAYDKDGNVIFESSNKGKTNVSVPKYIDEQNEGGYSIHNHPAEATFSAQDISNYERYGQNGLVCDIEGNEYILLNKNPSVDDLVKKAKTEEEVAELMPFSTAAHKAFSEIDNDVMTRRREYSKELMATETDGSVRSAKMREWMAENNPENLKNAWLEENASKYGFEFKKQKLKGEDDTKHKKGNTDTKRPMKDVTSKWTKKEKDGKIISQMEYTVGNTNFVVDNKFVLFEHDIKENKIAKLLSEKYGKEVRLLPRVVYPQNVQIPDYLIDGSRYDLKSPTGSGKDVLRDIIKKKKQQSHNFIYNISDCPLPLDEIERQVTQIFKAPNTNFVEQIVLVNYDEVLKVYSKK